MATFRKIFIMKTLVTLCGILMLMSACRIGFNSVRGNGNKITQSRNTDDFKKVEVGGPMDVEITMGNDYKVDVEADDNLMAYIIVKKEGDKLVVRLKDNVNADYDDGMKVKIEMPLLNAVELSGSGSIKTIGQVSNNGKISISIGGSGNVDMDNVKSPVIDAAIGGSGKATVAGQTQKLDVSIGGSGDFIAPDLKSENAKVSIAGSGNAKIFASMDLDVSIVGSGDVIYSGSPRISKNVLGSGSIRAAQ